MDDEERRLSPADAEDLILRVAAEETVSHLSMDSVFDPTPSLELEPWPPAATGRKDYTSVLLRSMGACLEPSLSPSESIQWAAYVVVRILARITRNTRILELRAALRGMCEVRRGHDGWHPMRRAVGWLLTHELQRIPPGRAPTREPCRRLTAPTTYRGPPRRSGRGVGEDVGERR